MNEIHDLLPELGFDDTEPDTYRSNRYDIVSKVGYLIGVSLTIFESENSTLDKSVFEQLNADKNARIIRNLCILRTHMFRGYSKIEAKLRYEMKNIDSIPEYIPSESVTELQDDGVGIWHANWRINQYLMYICDEIKNRNLFVIFFTSVHRRTDELSICDSWDFSWILHSKEKT